VDPSPRRRLEWSFLGSVPYGRAVEMQLAARDRLRRGEGPERLFLLEHPHVYTLGRNADAGDIVAAQEWLRRRGVEVEECDRGGQVTYHGPGQLVGYPVLNLDPDRRDVRRYVRDLQEALIQVLALYGIAGERREGQAWVGVWAGGGKIASLGVHISRWLTTHGFALNVSTDLSYFGGIVPCGLPGVSMVSIQSLTGASPPLAEVAAVCARALGERFERQLVERTPSPALALG
jgi:lipoyl(octanoyl) transferase